MTTSPSLVTTTLEMAAPGRSPFTHHTLALACLSTAAWIGSA